jgi:hypothetical protein
MGWIRGVVGAALVAALALGLSAADPSLAENVRVAAFGAEVMVRADAWYRESLDYSQDRCYGGEIGYTSADWSGSILGGCHRPSYRTDCSGFVSMAWNLPFSYATPRPGDGLDLADITRPIPKEQLRPGDALIANGPHVRLFEKWTNRSRTRYLAYDFGSTPVKHQEYGWGASGEYQYTPVRLEALP